MNAWIFDFGFFLVLIRTHDDFVCSDLVRAITLRFILFVCTNRGGHLIPPLHLKIKRGYGGVPQGGGGLIPATVGGGGDHPPFK